MIDATTVMISVGVVAQAVPQAQRMFQALRPRVRAPGVLASLAFTPLPLPDPALDALVLSISAPAIRDR